MISWLKLGWTAVRFAWENRKGIQDAVEGIVDGEPKVPGMPLSHKDVDHIHEQIRSATEHKVNK